MNFWRSFSSFSFSRSFSSSPLPKLVSQMVANQQDVARESSVKRQQLNGAELPNSCSIWNQRIPQSYTRKTLGHAICKVVIQTDRIVIVHYSEGLTDSSNHYQIAYQFVSACKYFHLFITKYCSIYELLCVQAPKRFRE